MAQLVFRSQPVDSLREQAAPVGAVGVRAITAESFECELVWFPTGLAGIGHEYWFGPFPTFEQISKCSYPTNFHIGFHQIRNDMSCLGSRSLAVSTVELLCVHQSRLRFRLFSGTTWPWLQTAFDLGFFIRPDDMDVRWKSDLQDLSSWSFIGYSS